MDDNSPQADSAKTDGAKADSATTNIAVSVIGGYLGAGKTTLLNHILRTADERIAVLVNDFGDINIDEALIESNDGDTMALSNGCICCSLIDGFGAALRTINELNPRPERLVIEASGVADPASVAAWGHSPGFSLDATIVVADAETVRAKSKDKYVGDTVLAQLRSGDIVIANKMDLLDDETQLAVTAWIAEQCPDAVAINAVNAVVDPLVLFGIEPRAEAVEPAHIHAHEIFETWDWTQAEASSRTDIEAMMDDLADSVVRAKGVVWLDDEPEHQSILQRVGRRWTIRRGQPWANPADRASQIVFIGVKADT